MIMLVASTIYLLYDHVSTHKSMLNCLVDLTNIRYL